MKLLRFCVVGLTPIILATGCAIQSTKTGLFNIFNAKGFDVKETDSHIIINLTDLYFSFDSTLLTQSAFDKLDFVSSLLNAPGTELTKIIVEGHTDAVGNKEYNELLSLRRANVVADRLVFNGVNNDRITRRGFGQSNPLDLDTTTIQDSRKIRAQNRRVEISIEF